MRSMGKGCRVVTIKDKVLNKANLVWRMLCRMESGPGIMDLVHCLESE